MKTKYMIIAVALLLSAVPAIDAKAQWDVAQNTGNETFENHSAILSGNGTRAPFAKLQTPPPSYAPPPGESGNGQKLPINEGFWILTGAAVIYGIVRRRSMMQFSRVRFLPNSSDT